MHSAEYEEAVVGVLVDVEVEVEPPVQANKEGKLKLAIAFLFKCIAHIVNLLKPLFPVLINYYQKAFGEESVITPPSPLAFIITSLYAFAEMKSQGAEFPFQTHPRSINIAVTSLLFYGLASAAEHFISATRLGPASVYAIIAHLGRICCLCILVASLASLFYL